MLPEALRSVPLRPHPHVLILGAGASYAATPQAERSGRRAPLMNQLPAAAELRKLLSHKEYAAAQKDFEGFYDDLVAGGRTDLSKQVEERVWALFDTMRISESVTLYDRLVLSLRKKDVIATFNWDPLLPYAYRRSGYMKALPALLFLHGNVRLGICRTHHKIGWNDDRCNTCGQPLEQARLLYPVRKKDYTSDLYLREQWSHLDWFVSNAYFVTVFGYSAPKTDVEARSRIADRLFSNRLRGLLQVEIADPRAEELIKTNLGGIVGDTHYGPCFPIEASWLFMHPRLTCEALFQATMMQDPIIPYELPGTDSLSELQQWAREFHESRTEFAQEGQPWQG